MSSAGKSTLIHTTTHTRVDPAPSQSPSQNNTQSNSKPDLINLRKTTSGFSSPKLSSIASSGAFPEGPNDIDDDARFDRLLFSQPLFAAELDSANWKRSLSCINDVEFAENDVHTIPWACHRRLRCPVCAFLDKAGRQRCGGGEEGMEKVASKFGWIIDKSEEVNAVLTDFHTKEVNKEMAAQLKEVIKMLKGQLSDAVDELFKNEMEMIEVYEKKQAKIVYRNRILTEIASTEKDYYNSLTVIKNTWKVDFVDSGLLPEGVINMIFSNIDDIVTTTDKMIKKIDVEKGKEYGDQMVGKIFVDLIPELKGYVDYCPMQDRAQRVYYEQIKSNSKFKELVTKTRIDKHQTTKGQDLPSFLIKPTQRITKYPLFLKDLIKHTDTKHPDYPSLLKAEEEIKKFLEEINIKTRRQVTLDAIEKLKPTIIWRSDRSIDFERSQCTFITESKSKCVYQAKEGGPSEKGKSIVLFDSVMLVLYKYHGKFREVATIPIDTITEVIDNDDPQNSPIKPPNKMTVSQQQQQQQQQPSSSPMMQLQSPASLSSISAQNVPPSTPTASMSQSSVIVPASPQQSALTLSSSVQSATVDISASTSAVDTLNGSNMGGAVPANQGGSASLGGEDVTQSQNGESAQLVTSTSRLGSNIANSITIVTSKEENIVIKPKEEFEKQHLLTTLDEIVHNARKTKLHSLEYVLTESVTSTPITVPSASTSPTAQLNLNMANEEGEEPTTQPMSPATQQQQQQQQQVPPPTTPRPTSPSLSHRKSDATPQESGLLTPPVVVLNPQGSVQGHKYGKSMQLPQSGAGVAISSPQQQQQDQQSLQKGQRQGGQDRKTKKINLFNGVRKNANQNDDSLSSSPVTAVSLSPQESNLEGVTLHPGHRKANSSSVVVLPPPKQLTQPTTNVISTGNTDNNAQSQQQQQQQQQQDPSSDSTESPRDPGTIVAAQGGGSGSSEDNENDEHGTKNVNIEINVNVGESERPKHKKKRVTTTHFPSFRKKKQHEQENAQKAAVSGSGSAEELYPRLPPSQSPPPFDCPPPQPPSGGENGNADVKPQEQSLPPLPSVPDPNSGGGGGSKSLNITPKSTLRKGVTGTYDDDDVEIAMAPPAATTSGSNSGNDSRPTKKHKKFSISSSLRKRRTNYDEDDSAESSADSPATHAEEPAESKRPVSKRKGKKRLGFLSLGRKSERYLESDPHLSCLDIPQTANSGGDTSNNNNNNDDNNNAQNGKLKNGDRNHEKEISPPPPPLARIKPHPKHSDVDIPPPLSMPPEQRLTHTTSLSSLGSTSAEHRHHQEEEEDGGDDEGEHMHSMQKKGGQIRLNPKSPRGLGTIPPPTSPPPPPHSASPSPGPSAHSRLRMEINIPPPPIPAPDPSASNSSSEDQKVPSSNHMSSPRQLKMPCSMQRPAETPPPPPPPSQQSPLPPQSSSMTSSSYSSSQQSQQSFGGNFPTSSSVSGEDSDSLSAHQEGGNRKSLPPPPPPKCAAPSPPPPQQPPQFVVSIPIGPPPSPPPSD